MDDCLYKSKKKEIKVELKYIARLFEKEQERSPLLNKVVTGHMHTFLGSL